MKSAMVHARPGVAGALLYPFRLVSAESLACIETAARTTGAIILTWSDESPVALLTFGHLRRSGYIMPDHARDRGTVHLTSASRDHLHIKQRRESARTGGFIHE